MTNRMKLSLLTVVTLGVMVLCAPLPERYLQAQVHGEMLYRRAADFLGCKFSLNINGVSL